MEPKVIFFKKFLELRGRYPDAEQEAFLDALIHMANEMQAHTELTADREAEVSKQP